MQDFADRVRKLRNSYGISQEKFAKRLGISRDYLSQLENGREPGRHVQKIIELFESANINPVGNSSQSDETDLPATHQVNEDSGNEYLKRRKECEDHLKKYLDRTATVPGAVDHALIQLRLHLPLSDVARLAKDQLADKSSDAPQAPH